LVAVEMARATGAKDLTLNEFEQNMRKAIASGKRCLSNCQ